MLRRLRAQLQEAVGSRLGRFHITSVLGEGGMGVVYKAVDDSSGRAVALKVLRRELAGQEVYRRRFAHEVRAAGAVRHNHLVAIVDAGEAQGELYLAMEYVDGESLDNRIRRGPLLAQDVAAILVDVGSGLDALHGNGIVHRDVKPSNILVDREGRAKLTDFGLARGESYSHLTTIGAVMGTLDYVAPEVIGGATASPASDIYSLGCVAYECVTGTPPFADRARPGERASAALHDAPQDPAAVRSDISRQLSWALVTALAKVPGERPPTAAAYAQLVKLAATART